MKLNRRNLLKTLSATASALVLSRLSPAQAPLFEPTRHSLQSYRIPDWFRDAKFGIWSHWGPQSAIEEGDWYARNMYMQGSEQYRLHVEHYGHPTKVGYKDLVGDWKAAKWDPDHLMDLYKKAGAKYFVSMGVHHDNFDLWDSKYNRWNAVKMGPMKDVVGTWANAARNHGLRFGVSDHLWISYKWWGVAHLSDKTGSLAGVAYDGADPNYADLYHDADSARFDSEYVEWNDNGIPDRSLI
jgi:alpha-L-fucosidase